MCKDDFDLLILLVLLKKYFENIMEIRKRIKIDIN